MPSRFASALSVPLLALAMVACAPPRASSLRGEAGQSSANDRAPEQRLLPAAQARAAQVLANPRAALHERVAAAAIEQTTYTRIYDASYQKLDYPGGDVPADRGACTDVVIRAFRRAEVDLQEEIHEDISRNFAAYPRAWGASKPDSNIDHRRVPNLMTYFERRDKSLPVTNRAEDYASGDVVTWRFDNGLTHTGVVTGERAPETGNPLVVHNIGAGARLEDVLFAWRITGRYRYFNPPPAVGGQSRRN